MYSERIPQAGYAAYRQALLEWLLAYPKRTGRADDCLTSLKAYLVVDESPAPGVAAEPSFVDRTEFLRYDAPKNGDCKPQARVLATASP
jgi:hypothetical protein